MSVYRFALKCPYCNQSFDAGPPDNWHYECSFKEPLMDDQRGNVIRQKYTCKNPKCSKPIAIYWYNPMEYYDTM